jgi:nondiscriminating glutamyl-tRNA synthetase
MSTTASVDSTKPVRVRIAPSPTGNLHVGTARTALFNYLFAQANHGTFILRVEDTDLERSQEGYTQNIFDGLKGLGLTWTEGPDVGGPYAPYQQSQRLPLYQQWAQRLLEAGHAYYCYKTAAELDAEREQAMANNQAYSYQRLSASQQQALASTDPSRQPCLRFKIPDDRGTITFTDVIRGDVSFDPALLGGDFVLMKSNGTPSYNFAVVVDDITMEISHVIRGEDHIPNTPRQLLLFEAFGVTPPLFAHAGMILAPDRSKLSKRHGATAVSEFLAQGYLPQAFCNFLALLGWSAPNGQEQGTLAEFASQFTLERITHSPAIFDQDKLNWLNGQLIRQLPLPDLLALTKPFLAEIPLSDYNELDVLLLLDSVREPLVTLGELPDAVGYFFGEAVEILPEVVEQALGTPEATAILEGFLRNALSQLDFTSHEALATGIKAFTTSLKPLKAKPIMWAIRAATTGRVHGADLSKTLYLLGHDRTKSRIQEALALCSSPA